VVTTQVDLFGWNEQIAEAAISRVERQAVTLRPYQLDSVNAAFDKWQTHNSTLVNLPTGCGKSVVFAEVMRRWDTKNDGRILLIAHRKELIYQAVGHARRAGLTSSIEMASKWADRHSDVVIASVATLAATARCKQCLGDGCLNCTDGKIRRFTRFDPDDFGLVTIDECHHATAASFRKVATWFQQNPKLKELFVTATPNRTDKVGLHNVCQSVAYEMNIETAINDGWLVPIRQKFVTVDGLDISQVKVSQGDLAAGELQSAFLGTDETEERLLHAIVKPTIEEAAGRKTLVFASGKEHAVKLTAAFVANGVDAEYVTDDTDETTRANIVARFRDSDLHVLVNCMVFTEGFDAPSTAVIANCRPTKSESLYLQIIGRATRPLPGVVDGPETAEARRQAIEDSEKTHCLVLDFVGISGKHKPKSVIDILAGSRLSKMELDEAVAVAKRTGEEVDIEKLVERVKQAREAKAAAREKRLTRTKADRADYTATDVALFDGPRFEADPGEKMASASQRWVLTRKIGIAKKAAKLMTMRQASAIISKRRRSVEDNWKRAINTANSIAELQHVGEKIRQVKEVDYWLKNDSTTQNLRGAWLARKAQLKGMPA